MKKQIKEAQKGATTSKTQTVSKKTTGRKSTVADKKKSSKKKSTVKEDSSEPPDLEPLEPPTPWSEYLVEKGTQAWEYAYNNRAFVLFGVASIGIYMYGDYASV